MQLLIVHHDAEVSEPLARMVNEYTAHDCDLVANDDAARRWARAHADCGLLLTQLEGPGIDGLTLAGLLGELFSGLQTLFLPAYPASEQRLAIAKTKVFPEPIDGERLLEAIEAAAIAQPGGPDLFHVLDVLQMCCLSKLGGALQMVKRTKSGIVFLRDGKIIHAESEAAHGTEALLEIAAWDMVEFAYDPSIRGRETIAMPWDKALIQAVVRDKEKKARALAESKFEDPAKTKFAPPAKRGFFRALRRG